ncbi:MAG TPA: DUF222 domain-containing protein [Mycobacteriales bacterium]|nr:DUF222 domain-containing protein [Mycobacteriales bacterium]
MTEVVAAVDKLRADESLITAPEMLVGDVEALLEAITVVQAVAVRRLREARAVDATGELYGRSPKRWLVEDLLLPAAEASRLLRLVHQLPAHPATETAHADGQINTGHAAAILTAVQSLPAGIRETVEPHLIERAREFPPEEIAGFVDELLQGLGLDAAGEVRRERRHVQRGVDLATTLAGTRCLTGTLTPEVGERLEAALAIAGQKSGPDDDRTARQRRHDAFGVLADAYLAAQAPSFTGAPRTVIVTLDLDTLEGRRSDTLATLPSGAVVSPDTARRLACDAELIPVVLGRSGEILDIGQADHEFTTPIRRAAYLRDGGRCAFPRCANPCVELHHLVFRRHGGPTSLDNAAWLCPYHHHLVHEGGWTLRRTAEGHYQWTSPHGRQHIRHLDPLGRRSDRNGEGHGSQTLDERAVRRPEDDLGRCVGRAPDRQYPRDRDGRLTRQPGTA